MRKYGYNFEFYSEAVDPHDKNKKVLRIGFMNDLQPASFETWDSKYRLKSSDGTIIDTSLGDTYRRVARELSDVEKEDQFEWSEKFLWALQNGAIPAGRIISNLGSKEHKKAVSTINCTVSNSIDDSMEGILESVKDAGLTLKSGAGVGYEFSTIRPKGAHVAGAGAKTTGPLPFMEIFDSMCSTVASAGARRGAQMGTFDIAHPDIRDFIKAKRKAGMLRQFNLSCLITDDFMHAVKNNLYWDLHFDGKIYETVRARDLWDEIMQSTYDFAEPGFILIDRVNELNNNWFCEDIRATNPCGEQPLPPNGSCLLGSVNLTKFVTDPFTDEASFDWKKFDKVVKIFTRMLDNVCEKHGLPLNDQRIEIERKRRHGMGFLGLGSALTMMKIRYGSEDSLFFTSHIAYRIAKLGLLVGIELAKEKGPAPVLRQLHVIDDKMLERLPDHYEKNQLIKGNDLFVLSKYIQRFPESIQKDLKKHGCRFTHHSSIAPTGTISLSLGNNASNGIEPTFAHEYNRNMIVEGKKTKEMIRVYSYEFLLYKKLIDENATVNDLPDYFVTTDDVTPIEHINVQAAAQKWVDSSISKTINVPTDYPFEDFKSIYMDAYDRGVKGVTTFRFNPDAFQGVLVRDDDLKGTTYQITLEDGEVVELAGHEEVEYEGETHTAANLYDALKEGYYGKL